MLKIFKNNKIKKSDEGLSILNKIVDDFHVAYSDICTMSTNYSNIISENEAWENHNMPIPEELNPYLHSWSISSDFHRQKVTYKDLPNELKRLAHAHATALDCFYRKKEYECWRKNFSDMSFKKFKRMPRK